MISPDALRELASLVETAPSIRAALGRWTERSAGSQVAGVSRRAELGAAVSSCVAPLGDPATARAIEAHLKLGGSLSTTLRALADAHQHRQDLAHAASTAALPSRLSTRLLGGLALVCMSLVPMWRQVSAVVLVVTGIAASGLVALGLLWMRKLQPVPGADDGAAVTADLLAGLVTAGLPLREAIMVALPDELHRPRRQIGLGMAPPKAVQAIGGRDWIEIGTLLEHAAHDGAPCAGGLRHLATEMRERRRRDMEVAARKAPVLLVLPLTLCFLPAFAIVLVVPMMRGLAG